MCVTVCRLPVCCSSSAGLPCSKGLPGLPMDTAAPAGPFQPGQGQPHAGVQLTLCPAAVTAGLCLSAGWYPGSVPAPRLCRCCFCRALEGSDLSASSAAMAGACRCPRQWFLPAGEVSAAAKGGLGSCSPSLGHDGSTSLCFLLLTWAPTVLFSKLFLEVLEAPTGKMVLLNVSKGKALFSQCQLQPPLR